MIAKTAVCTNSNYKKTLYYDSAREGMHNIVQVLFDIGEVNHILLPGYIGWSPREGSGIFDSFASIEGLQIEYYKMTEHLHIDLDDLLCRVHTSKTLVLLVNYFGFRDPRFVEILAELKKRHVLTMEDNAHGFFTWHETAPYPTDVVVFSLHKMFPFPDGGSLVLQNDHLAELSLSGNGLPRAGRNPFEYHIHEIACIRRENYSYLMSLIDQTEASEFFCALRSSEDIKYNVPQTFPIKILHGDRNRIYQMMNDIGYGVVSLYHTMIEPLHASEYNASLALSRCIMNLPVHQDVDAREYVKMLQLLVDCCKRTAE